MTEPIKQEIINNIFENGDKLITGPILQTVLIDMIDDVNVKDQEILSKTGSWDEAVTQIPNLATKAELTEAKDNLQANITNLSESVARDIANVDSAGYATETWVESQGYLKEHQDISNLATKTELTAAETNLQGNITSLSESVARDLANVDVDLTGYATEQWVESKGYLTEHQDISGLATKVEVTSLSESVARDLANVPEGVATEQWVQSQDYASKSYVDNAVSSSSVDLTGYATETWVQNQGYLTEHQDISGLATKTELTSVSQSIQTDISNLATKGELTSVSQSVQTDITNLSESVANSAVWKKGTGTDSVVKILTGDNEASTPTATGYAAVATGYGTHATGWNSHAEGQDTIASNYNSHAEGRGTIATNVAEHAEGTYNHSSENQIFSIGAGGDENGSLTRKNAVSVLVVPNSETQINTSSFFVQNVGGYDGTNPEPGTNDLATVIGEVSSIWKKGTGTDSIVQKLTNANETNTPTATGTGAVAIGFVTTASGDNSHAEGNSCQSPGQASHAEGSSTIASGWGSHAEGDHTTALEHCSHAEGNHTTASAGTSHAEGSDTLTLGWSSHAEGQHSTASAHCSHAEGLFTNASGSWSHAEGNGTKTSGDCSHAEGNTTVASGNYSHAEGDWTIASNSSEHAEGRFNHSSENQVFSIGTGNSDTDRRNAVSVLEVSNNNSYTSSFFVQNIGGYDGTNPTPGTNDLATVISSLSSSGGSSETLWKKGEGENSVVQVSSPREEECPTAIGPGAVAIGQATTASNLWSHAEGVQTNASGEFSHAEGSSTNASGFASHAEGYYTTASGDISHAEGSNTTASKDGSHAEGDHTIASGYFSHAEGTGTIAANDSEHAQGMFNHNSENQIFSIGAGDGNPNNPETATRRNALSVLAVPNSETQINTASFFVQNIGGYNGTNPLPGTNDLATVINGMAIEGGIGTSSETWTFTLNDGSTVTKNIVMR